MKSFYLPALVLCIMAIGNIYSNTPALSTDCVAFEVKGLLFRLHEEGAKQMSLVFSELEKAGQGDVYGLRLQDPYADRIAFFTGPNDIEGKVWEDWNFNGVMDEFDTIGVNGVEVQLFDCAGNMIGSTTSDNNGYYLLDGGNTTFSGNANDLYRIEFVLPDSISSWAKETQTGIDNGSSVQFVKIGDTANFGLSAPADFCQSNPLLVTNCFIEGDNTGTGDVLLSYASQSPSSFNHESIANQIGTTYGLAFQRASNNLFASAFLKRFAGFESSPGSIFRIPNPKDGVTSGAEFLDINTLFGSDVAGSDPHNFVDVTSSNDVIDANAYALVGKMSFGDLDISSDERSLWVVNLFDRALYKIPLGDDPANPSAPTLSSEVEVVPMTDGDITAPNPLPDLPNGISEDEIRPFALKVKNNTVYVGMVTNGEDAGPLYALVYAYSIENQVFTKVLEFSLDYNRGCALAVGTTCRGAAKWNAWTDIYPGSPAMAIGNEHAHPQPVFADIDFDGNGNMLIGLRDRFGDQTGYQVPRPNGNSTLYTGDGLGDILMASPDGSGNWTMNIGQFTDNTLSIPSNGTTETEAFFGGDYYKGSNDLHEETASGGLAVIPGTQTVITTNIDPISSFSAGVDWFNTSSGNQFFALEILAQSLQFNKANGLGEVEALCNPAPIEIGNYVWEDLDGDGIQDACEPGLADVNVHLFDTSGVELASTTTDVNGQYYFSHSDSTDQTWITVPDSVGANTMYFIVVGKSQFSNGQLNINGDDYSLTVDSTDSGSNRYVRDSDGTIAQNISVEINGLPYVKMTTGDWGASDHSLDFGFYYCLPVDTILDEKICDGTTYFFDNQNIGISGTYYDTLQSVDGCDSILTLQLVVQLAIDTLIEEDICPGDTYSFFGNDLTVSGIYRDTQYYNTGCDSIRTTLDLTVLPDCIPPVFDLALRKTLAPGQPRYVLDGDTVKFRVYVFNQGNMTAFNVLVLDYQPIGFDYISSLNSNWLLIGANPSWFIPMLPPGGTDSLDIFFKLNSNATNGDLFNYAEIIFADDDLDGSNDPPTDHDSTPNSISFDDPGGEPGTAADNVITGDGSGAVGSNDPLTDEDDHDGEAVYLTEPILSLGNLVFFDLYNDGLFNNSDYGVEGVTVELYEAGLDELKNTADDTFIESQLTGVSGEYSFNDLIEGLYYVKLTGAGVPTGYRSSTGGGVFDNDGMGTVEPAPSPDDNMDNVDDGTQMITMIMSDTIRLIIDDEPDGNQNWTLDFGLYSPQPEALILGNLVFFDQNNDGVFNNNDEGIEGVELSLYGLGADGMQGTVDDNFFSSTSTDSLGEYEFTGLLEGTYYVKLTGVGIPTDAISSTGDGVTDVDGAGPYEPAIGTDNNEDDVDDGTRVLPISTGMVMSDTIVLTFNNEINDGDNDPYRNPSVDFGLYVPQITPTVSVGDLVFHDKANNGVFDGSDVGLEGIEVILMSPGMDGFAATMDDVALDTTKTDMLGGYLFSGLADGEYFIKLSGVGVPADYVSSTGDGVYDNDNTGLYEPASSANTNVNNIDDGTQMGDMVISSVFDLAVGTETGDDDADPDHNASLDFGFYLPQEPPYFDLALRKTLAVGQAGLVGIGDPVSFKVTVFNQGNVPAYNVLILDYLPLGLTFNAVGSPGWFNFGAGPTWFLPGPLQPGDSISQNIKMTVNGLALPGTVNNFAEITSADDDTDGSNDLPTDIDSSPDAFFGNDPGGTPNLPADDAINGDGTGAVGSNDPLTDEDDMDGATVELDIPTLILGNLVFADLDNDGIFNNLDTGINGVTLELYEVGNDGEKATADDVYIDFKITNSIGEYVFQIYAEGLYYVKLTGDGIPADYVSSTGEGVNDYDGDGPYEPATGTDTNVDNEDDGTQMSLMVMSDTIRLTFGNEPSGAENNNNYTVDFGLYEPIILEIIDLGNLVFHDENNDGVFNNTESGIEDVEVKLFTLGLDGEKGTADDVEVATTLTNGFGEYQFIGVDPGLYYVKLSGEGIPTGYVSSTGEGIYDGDGDGPFEPSLGTDNNLDSLDDGSQMGNMVMSDTIRLTYGGEPDFDKNYTVDFGLFKPEPEPILILGDLVFADVQNNAFYNGGDYGLEGVEVKLMTLGPDEIKGTNDDVELMTTSTNGNGEYQFSGFPQGLYYVKLSGVGIPANWVSSTGQGIYDNDGAGTFEPSLGTDNNFNNIDDGTQMGSMIMSDTIRLTWFQEPEVHTNNTVDFGLYEPRELLLGNLVFADLENDGLYNNYDYGIEGVEVALLTLGPDGEKGTADDVQLSTQSTNNAGKYLFTGLVEGAYYVKLTGVGIPTNFISATGDGIYDMDGAGTYEPATGTDLNVDDVDDGTQMAAMIMSETISLTLGGEPDGDANYTVDFGLYEPQIEPKVSLGNLVFHDMDNDGIFNNSDVGIEDVEVVLFNAGPDGEKGTMDDVEIATQTTNGFGEYFFDDLQEGLYYATLSGTGISTNFISSTGDGIYDMDGAGAYEPFVGTNNNVDDNDDGTQMGDMIMSDTIRLTAGSEPNGDINLTVDFGLYEPQIEPTVSVGNLVFSDIDNDGVYNNIDTVLEGVEVEIYSLGPDEMKGTNDDVLINTETTNNLGEYQFTGLPEGVYYLKLNGVGIPANFISSTGDGIYDMDGAGAYEPSLGTDGNADDIDDGSQMGNMVMSDTIRLTLGNEPEGDVNNSVDFGLYEPQPLPTLSLGDLVFHDLDNDGIFNNNDEGIEGVEVELYGIGADGIKGTGDDTLFNTLLTNILGQYQFTGLVEGLYYVKLSGNGIPSGFESSTGDGIYDLDSAGAYEPIFGTDNNVDGEDDGAQMGAMIMSDTIRLTLFNEPETNVNNTVDFGLFAPKTPPIMELGNLVFHDLDNDGVFNNADSGLGGVEVELYGLGADGIKGNADDSLFASQTTIANGAYLFQNLFEGLYYVKLSGDGVPANYVSSTGDGIYDQDGSGAYEPYFGTDDDTDNEDDGSQMGAMVMSDTIRLVFNGEPDFNTNTTVDFGLFEPQDEPTNSLGNLVFQDFDNDGIFNNNDMGLMGVEVELYDVGIDGEKGTNDDVLVDTKTTDNNGQYLFSGLAQGLYYVKLNGNGIPTDYVSSTGDGIYDQDGAGAFEPIFGTDSNVDNQDDGSQMGAMIMSDTIRLTWFEEPNVHENTTVDFGLYEPQDVPTLSLGNLVFDDQDNDGIFNNNDVGLADVEVKLFDIGPDSLKNTNDDVELATHLTGGLGGYLFTGLSEGLYYVKLSGSGIPTGYISSTGDGRFDNDGSGAFEPIAGTDNNIDQQDDGTQMGAMIMSDTVRLTLDEEPDGNINLTVDFGLYLPLEYASVGDLVWWDDDRDGQQGATPTGVPSVTITLFDLGADGLKGTNDDIQIDETSTDPDGIYSFTGLVPGDYYVMINALTLPANYELTSQDQGADATDSDFNAMGMSAVFTLNSGENNTSIDAGIEPKKSSLGNFVWFDNNHSGQQDSSALGVSEPGVPQLPVHLFGLGNDGQKGGGDDNLIASTTTDDDGYYLFTDLEAGSYYVQFDMSAYLATYSATPQDIGIDTSDSDGNSMGMTDVIVLGIGEENMTIDFGIEPELASLGDYVWFDNDHDGQQGPNEPGVPDMWVYIFDLGNDGIKGGGDDVQIDSVQTLADGSYLFTSLEPGSYYVMFDVDAFVGMYSAAPQNFGDDATDSDGNGGGMTDIITLGPAEYNPTIDFGLEPDHATIGDFVWYDDNVNGQQDNGETGVENVLVRLFNLGADGQKGGGDDLEYDPTLTDSSGFYQFNFLEPGDYYVQFDLGSLPTDYFPTTPDAGDDATDSDANQMGMTEVVTLGPGENNPTLDMGIYNPMFDLALTKNLAPGQTNMVDIGQTVHYQITVKNEGLTTAYNVVITDHIPAGLLFSQNGTDWTLINDSTASYEILQPILPNGEIVLDIYLTVQYGASGASLVNVAEVSSATDMNGSTVNDIDSTPANDDPNEDDLDDEEIVLLDHDPTGWIYCEKTGRILSGGTITVTGPNGIVNDEVVIISDGSSGYYEFYAVGSTGTYTIQFTHPEGYPLSLDCPPGGVFNPTNGGPAVTLGSLENNGYLIDTSCVSNPYYFQFDLEPGDPAIYANNIPVQCSYIGSIVCEDTNNNDMVDSTDQLIVGATVNLYHCNDPNTIIATSVTDANGHYEFDGLTLGNYMVGYQLPVGTRFVSNGTMNTNGFSNCINLNWGDCDTSKLICQYTCPQVTADDQTICYGGMAQLLATVPYGSGTFNWLPPNDLSATNISNPVASPPTTTVYMVTYMDGLGCLMSDDATVNILNTSPYLTYTPFLSQSVECDQPVPFEAPVFADSCDNILTITLDSMVIAPGCGTTIERTWTATNAQGNSSTFTQTVNIFDNTPPVMMANHSIFGDIFHGDTLYADCVDIPSLDSLGFSAFDLCCATTITFEENVIHGDCNVDGFVEMRYCGWTATDCCGNMDSLFFTVIVQDNTPPVLVGVPASVTVTCGNVPPVAIVTATDSCSGDAIVDFEESTWGDTTSGCHLIMRMWSATDSCGNTASQTQNILVRDVTPPTLLNVPPSGVADCADITTPMVTAIDNCDGDVPVAMTENLVTDSSGCGIRLERTWTAFDGCGNMAFATQMLILQNNDVPELTITHPLFAGHQHGDTIYLECNQVAVLSANDATATADCCGEPTIEFHEYVSNGDCSTDGYLMAMICGWTATDCCGNRDSLFLHIIVVDNTAPVLQNVPADRMYFCASFVPMPPNVMATDNCDDNPTISFSESTVFVNGSLQTIRTWTATDQCGNSTSQTQTITFTQEDAPFILNVPADITVPATADVPPPSANVMAGDDCDPNPSLSVVDVPTGSGCCYYITRTWTAVDNYGLTATASQIITVEDAEAPIITGVPANVTVECEYIEIGVSPISVSDNCTANPVVSFTQDTIFNTCYFIIIRTWIATDDCGNSTSETQLINVTDTEPPTMYAFHSLFGEIKHGDMLFADCSQIASLDSLGFATTDNCGGEVTRTFEENVTAGDCPTDGFIEMRYCGWTVTDACGNTDSLFFTVFITDNFAPILSGVPADVTIDCSAPPNDAIVTATDNCIVGPLVMTEDTINFVCPNTYTIVRTWSATDECDNMAIGTQTITVMDDTPPTTFATHAYFGEIQHGDTLFADCSQIASLDSLGFATSDNCGEVTRTFEENVTTGDCPTDGFIEMRYCGWTVTDACGNTDSLFFTVFITDNFAPILSGVPADVTIDCSAPPNDAIVTATDNCNVGPVVMTEDTVNILCPNTYTILRTWSATDECENMAVGTQTITVVDVTPPTTFATHSLFGEIQHGDTLYAVCSQIPSLDSLGFATSDDCSEVTRTFEENVIHGNCLADGFAEKRYCGWTVTDACGNRDSLFFTVIITDNEPPVLSGIPADITVECDSVPVNNAIVLATDDCYENLPVVFTTDSIPGICIGSYIIQRSWTATDSCGNVSTGTQQVTVVNDTPPILYAFHNFFGEIKHGDTLYADCTQIPSLDSIGFDAYDDCCETTWTFEENVIFGNCKQDGFIEKRYCGWTATDCCGNTDSLYFTVIVQDLVGPVILGVPFDTMVICGNVPDFADVIVTDNCTDTPFVYSIETFNRADCPFLITRVWIAEDDCGNVTTDTQFIYVVEDFNLNFALTNPLLINASDGDTIVVECDDPILFDIDDATVMTNCGGDLTYTFEETNVAFGDCETDGFIAILANTWAASDECGHDTSVTIYVQYVDTHPPVFSNLPADTTIVCGGAVPPFGVPDVMDACGNFILQAIESVVVTPEGEDRTRSWIATDDCGNESYFTQTIKVYDSQVPVLETIMISPETCGSENGAVVVLVNGEESEFTYAWLPNLGTNSGTDGNSRTGLPSGAYQVIVADGPCKDTFQFVVLEECDCQHATVTDIDLTDATCGTADGQAAILIAEDVAEYSFTWIPNFGTPTANGSGRTGLVSGHYVVIIVHDGDNNCLTTVEFDLFDDCDLCGPMFEEEAYIVQTPDDQMMEVCLPVPFGVSIGMEVWVNGSLFAGGIIACDEQTVKTYDYSIVPGFGQNGPFSVVWDHYGQVFSTVVYNMDELAAKMSQVDSYSDWMNDKKAFQLISKNLTGNYGGLYVYSIMTEEHSYLSPENGLAEMGTTMLLPVGQQEVMLTNSLNDCSDVLQLTIEAVPEASIFTADTLVLSVPCDNGIFDYCFEIPAEVFSDFSFELDGAPIDDVLEICEYQSEMIYSLASLQWYAPPFTLDSWEANGQSHNGLIHSFEELASLMNQWDPIGSWTYDTTDKVIRGGSKTGVYTSLVLTHASTNSTFNLSVNTLTTPTKYGIQMGEGTHHLYGMHQPTGIGDDLFILLNCVSTDYVSISLPVGSTDTFCLDLGDLPGIVNTTIELCDGTNLSNAIVEPIPGTFCIGVNGIAFGTSQTCFVICDDNGFCDTTILQLRVLPKKQGPPQSPDDPNAAVDMLVVPGTVSPNGDGINDYLTIEGLKKIPNYHLSIFDPLGRPVFKTDNYQNDWDGSYSNGQVMNGIYFYVLELGRGQRMSGPIVIVK